jgi:hypothetical protein
VEAAVSNNSLDFDEMKIVNDWVYSRLEALTERGVSIVQTADDIRLMLSAISHNKNDAIAHMKLSTYQPRNRA